MYLAQIPPTNLLPTTMGEAHHLVLSHLMDTDRCYSDFYKDTPMRGWVTLDNGAHEQTSGEGPNGLLLKARQINANELVVPDVLFDGPATVKRAKEAREAWGKLPLPQLMYVPQGKTLEEWTSCLFELIGVHMQYIKGYGLPFEKFCIGVSKDYSEIFPHGLWDALQVIEGFQGDIGGPHTDVHMLGWPRNLWEITYLAQRYGDMLRSIDTAKAHVYALNTQNLRYQRWDIPKYPGRPDDYFNRTLNLDEMKICGDNLSMFRLAAQGRILNIVRDN